MTKLISTDPVVLSLIAWITQKNRGLSGEVAFTPEFEEMRLEDLVRALLDLDSDEAEQLDILSGAEVVFERGSEHFYRTLQQSIQQLHLFKLFARRPDGEGHRSLCLAAHNELTAEHHPEEMARWRADFRAMAPEQQMVAATLVWMYRNGQDSIWLRRVPCTWKASEALRHMYDTGSFKLWLRLIARYTPW